MYAGDHFLSSGEHARGRGDGGGQEGMAGGEGLVVGWWRVKSLRV